MNPGLPFSSFVVFLVNIAALCFCVGLLNFSCAWCLESVWRAQSRIPSVSAGCGYVTGMHPGASRRGGSAGEEIILQETLPFSVPQFWREKRGRGSRCEESRQMRAVWEGGSGSDSPQCVFAPKPRGLQGFTLGSGGLSVRSPDSSAR